MECRPPLSAAARRAVGWAHLLEVQGSAEMSARLRCFARADVPVGAEPWACGAASEAGEVVAVVQTAMLVGMPYTGLREAIFTHSTIAEGLGVLLTNVPRLGVA